MLPLSESHRDSQGEGNYDASGEGTFITRIVIAQSIQHSALVFDILHSVFPIHYNFFISQDSYLRRNWLAIPAIRRDLSCGTEWPR